MVELNTELQTVMSVLDALLLRILFAARGLV